MRRRMFFVGIVFFIEDYTGSYTHAVQSYIITWQFTNSQRILKTISSPPVSYNHISSTKKVPNLIM